MTKGSSFVVGPWSAPRLSVGGRFWLAGVFTFVAIVLSSATLASAQQPAGPEIQQLQVDLWPQYDDPRLLVIYKGDLSAPPEQPLRFPIPAGAKVNAVAHLDDQDSLINETWKSEASGDLQVITFTPATARFQLEYYLDMISSGPDRSFAVDIDVDGQTVNSLGIAVQQPASATNLQGEPALSGPVAGFQGLSFFSRQLQNVQPGQTVRQTVTYTKPDDTLTVDQIEPAASEPAGPPSSDASSDSGFATNLADRSATRFWLPIGAAVVILMGLALIGVGAWRARQEDVAAVRPAARRPRRRTRPQRAAEQGGPASFCHQCGAPFEPADQFCGECGAPRRAG
ncbi:MAG: zinc ribbon domain-containing protein [Anaerolineae bacterium]